MNDQGLFLLIFDGFDEMAQRVDINTTISNFNELAKTVTKKSKVILTCRTEYFKTRQEAQKLFWEKTEDYINIDEKPNFEIFKLLYFSKKKIIEFLNRRVPLIDDGDMGWKYYYDTIRSTYNLEELAKRPVLIDLITKSLPQLKLKEESINAGKLYDVYTDFWLERDIKSERTFMKKEDKRLFVKELALKMLLDEQLSIHYSKLPTTVKSYFNLKKSEEIDYFDHDIRTCSYLKRASDEHYKFAHKSFMEFFVAKKLIDYLHNTQL